MEYSEYFLDSKIGLLHICAHEEAITSIGFIEGEPPAERPTLAEQSNIIKLAALQLNQYFDQKRQDFDLPLALNGTAFQVTVWEELQNIPYGKRISYKTLAIRLNDVNLTRAVGAANGQNKIAIVIPCHRVVGANGSLTGYAYGTSRKQFLLDLESRGGQLSLF